MPNADSSSTVNNTKYLYKITTGLYEKNHLKGLFFNLITVACTLAQLLLFIIPNAGCTVPM